MAEDITGLMTVFDGKLRFTHTNDGDNTKPTVLSILNGPYADKTTDEMISELASHITPLAYIPKDDRYDAIKLDYLTEREKMDMSEAYVKGQPIVIKDREGKLVDVCTPPKK